MAALPARRARWSSIRTHCSGCSRSSPWQGSSWEFWVTGCAVEMRFVIGCACLTLPVLGVMFRPLLFASVDPEIAEARGLPVRGIGTAFMALLGFAVATAVQVIGVLLIFGFHLPYPPSFFIPALTFLAFLPRRGGM